MTQRWTARARSRYYVEGRDRGWFYLSTQRVASRAYGRHITPFVHEAKTFTDPTFAVQEMGVRARIDVQPETIEAVPVRKASNGLWEEDRRASRRWS